MQEPKDKKSNQFLLYLYIALSRLGSFGFKKPL